MPLPRPGTVPLDALAARLDAAPESERLAWLHALRPGDLPPLFEATLGRRVSLDDVHGPPGTVTIHEGVNSLPAFRRFQKRFVRLGDEVQGYNHQVMGPVTGPGHFVVVPSDARPGELLLDYTRLPAQVPPEFPPLQSNRQGLGRLVFGDMVDVLRRVSVHVTVGRATRRGVPTGDYFCLCRLDG